jgi:NADPH-dependent ferric siderophore reductase
MSTIPERVEEPAESTAASDSGPRIRRRPPPPFELVQVVRTERLSPWLVQVDLAGRVAQRLATPEPASSIRLLLTQQRGRPPKIPIWDGNMWVLQDGSRPWVRTLTPLHVNPASSTFSVRVVLHGSSPLCDWATNAQPGDWAAVSGPARGTPIDPNAGKYLLAGDESAIAAMETVLQHLQQLASAQVAAFVAVRFEQARVPLGVNCEADVEWLVDPAAPLDGSLVERLRAALQSSRKSMADVRVWAAGEASVMQRIRKMLFEEFGLPRSAATVRGYWKAGRAET